MKSVSHLVGLIALLSLFGIGAGGCMAAEETYPGFTDDQVWTAMVAVAQNPGYYEDWHIEENEVWANDEEQRIEVYRVILRDVIIPLGQPQRQHRTLQHQITLRSTEEGPQIRLTSRGMGVPIQAREEALMYFEDVWNILGGKPIPETTEATEPAHDGDNEPVDPPMDETQHDHAGDAAGTPME